MPGSAHSVSMALPSWDHVVGYEEKRPDVMRHLKTGYPRFVIHPLVQQVARELAPEGSCLPLPSAAVCAQCLQFLRSNGADGRLVARDGMSGVATNAQGADLLKAFWQHTGLIISTRQAAWWLENRDSTPPESEARKGLRSILAGFYDCEPGDVFLLPTGMAAQYAALRVLRALNPGLPTAQLGFPYVDTLKLQQKFGSGGILLHQLQSIQAELEALVHRQSIAGCFCEIPGNPLLGSADLRQIRPILRARGIPLVVDDVVATPANIDVGPYADLVATSLTKFIAGNGEVMGGALICNPRSPLYDRLLEAARAQHEELLWSEDASVLEETARDFPRRMERHNASGLLIAERLRTHPAVERVWYPKWEFSEAYESARRPNGGWGALVTFMPRNGEKRSPAIYDALQLCKGPSLGTVFTLACPFTLLAHYTELDWAEACGVSRYLIRLSIGTEDPEEIWTAINAALAAP